MMRSPLSFGTISPPADVSRTVSAPLSEEQEDKKKLALELYKGADSKRVRKIAEKCRHNWGLNRMYYIVSDQDKWMDDPMGTVRYLIDNLSDGTNFFDIEVHGFNIHICMVEH